MDVFQGCFKDTPHDYRHFAALYVALRFINPLLLSLLDFVHYVPTVLLFLVFVMVLVIKFQPYKSKRGNLVDTILLLNSVSGIIAAILNESLSMELQPPFQQWPKVIGIISILIPPSYIVILILVNVLPSNCFRRTKTFVSSNMSKMSKTKTMFVSKEQVLPVLPINRGPNYKTIQGN